MGARLRAVRVGCELGQREFAASIGVGKSAYARFETGEQRPSVQLLQKLQDTYGVPANQIIFGNDIPEEAVRAMRSAVEKALREHRIDIAALNRFMMAMTVDRELVSELLFMISRGDIPLRELRLLIQKHSQ